MLCIHFLNPVLTSKWYFNGLKIEPSNTNKYITGTLNKGQTLKGAMGGKCGEILGKGGSTKGGQQEGSMVGEVLMLAKCKMGKEGRFHGRKRGKVKGGIKQGGQALAKRKD